MFKGGFVTGYLQRELPLNCIIVNDMVKDELVKVTKNDDFYVVEKLSAESEDEAIYEATHIIAQADETLTDHVPVENLDYRYSDEVTSTIDFDDVIVGTETYWGVYFDTSDFPDSDDGVVVGDCLLYVDNTNDVISRYEYEAGEDTDPDAWAKDASFDDIPFADAIKNVALYKIVDKNDVIVRDEI